MVKEWGMSEKVGLRTIEEAHGFQKSDSLGPNTSEIVSDNRMPDKEKWPLTKYAHSSFHTD